MTTNQDIVQKLWSLCHILRDDGITYHQYVTELTLLLFLKMAKETGEEKRLPEGQRWDDLKAHEGQEQLQYYRQLLLDLGDAPDPMVRAIYTDASTSLRQPRHLNQLVTDIDNLDWFSARQDGLGDLYEGLLEKNANETKSGAGQYFTPRPLIDSMVHLMKPQPGEVIQDPAAGTAGFIIAADRYIKDQTDDLFTLSEAEQNRQKQKAYVGAELVPDTRRLAMMNLMLHAIESPIQLGDTLSSFGIGLGKADLILSNPPFGTKRGGGGPTRDDFTFPTSNKQLAFLQHIYRSLKPGGRAAVVLPDNVLFEDGVGAKIRADLMDKCNLHTILRLPTGIFYAQGVKTNVLFFTRGETDKGNTEAVWVYDLRANMPSFGKRTPFTREHFSEFETVFGDDPHGKSYRVDQGEEGRFRCFSREAIRERGENLDISWLRDENAGAGAEIESPEVLVAQISSLLAAAGAEMEMLIKILDGQVDQEFRGSLV